MSEAEPDDARLVGQGRASGGDGASDDAGALRGWIGADGPPLGERPAITTPEALQTPDQRATEHECLRLQPVVGLIGLAVVAVLAAILTFAAGRPEASVVVVGSIATFALPAVAMVAFWWEDWPGSSLRPLSAAVVDTLLIVVLAFGLTIAGQAVVAHVDFTGIFDPDLNPGHPTIFPVTLPLSSVAFVAMLQLTLVSERWPLSKLPRFAAGLVALVVVWAIAIVVQLLLVNFDTLPPEQLSGGVRNPGGPVSGGVVGAWLICVGVWQTILFVAWRGSVFRPLKVQWQRVLVGNVVTIAGGWLTYLLVRGPIGWAPMRVAAVGGCAIGAALLLSMLFDGWPSIRLRRASGRAVTLLVIAALAAGIFFGLQAIGDALDFSRIGTDDWIVTAALNFVGVAIITHVAVWRRWPLPPGYRRTMPGA